MARETSEAPHPGLLLAGALFEKSGREEVDR